MLKLLIPPVEFYDSSKEEFIHTKEVMLTLEHSLVSISKWEAKWHKPFISDNKRTPEESIDYIKCMTITQNVPNDVYTYLTNKQINEIYEYIDDKQTATWFTETKNPKQHGPKKKETITSELIYYWMVALEIPFECQKWHLNRLLTLIRVCNIKNNKKPKKMGKRESARNNAKLNAQRRAKLGSKG